MISYMRSLNCVLILICCLLVMTPETPCWARGGGGGGGGGGGSGYNSSRNPTFVEMVLTVIVLGSLGAYCLVFLPLTHIKNSALAQHREQFFRQRTPNRSRCTCRSQTLNSVSMSFIDASLPRS